MRSATASRCWRGTMARRMAVHFWPALMVISRTTSLTKRSNSSSSGVTSGARIAAFSESASALNGMLWRTTFGCTRSLAAVSAEPVKVTTSRPSRRSSRSPVEPITSCNAPAGRMPDSFTMRTIASVRKLVAVAGLPMQGMPARKLGANFSSRPQTGKLKALMCTATPPRGTRMCVPPNVPFLPRFSAGPSWIRLPLGSSPAPTLAYENSVPVPPSMSIQPSTRVAPVWAEMAYSSSLRSPRYLASALRRAARCWKSSASRPGRPTRRA